MSHVDWNVLRGQAFRLLDALDWKGSPNAHSLLKEHLIKVLVMTTWRPRGLRENDAAALSYFSSFLRYVYNTNPEVRFGWGDGFKLDKVVVAEYDVGLEAAVGILQKITGEDNWTRIVGPIVTEWDRFNNDYNAKVAAGTTPHALPPKPHTIKRTKTR